MKQSEQESAASRAALIQLEAQLIDIACDDAARDIEASVLLPMLRDRIESKAHEFYNRDVLQAQRQVRAPCT